MLNLFKVSFQIKMQKIVFEEMKLNSLEKNKSRNLLNIKQHAKYKIFDYNDVRDAPIID